MQYLTLKSFFLQFFPLQERIAQFINLFEFWFQRTLFIKSTHQSRSKLDYKQVTSTLVNISKIDTPHISSPNSSNFSTFSPSSP